MAASPVRTSLQVLAAGALALGVLTLLPPGSAFLAEHVIPPLRAQAEGSAGGAGYSVGALVFWGFVGLWLGTSAWLGLVRGLRVPADRRLAFTLAPFLVWGPLAHALLSADAFARGGVLAWLAAEPLVYATTAVLAGAGIVAGAALGRARGGAYAWTPGAAVGAVALAALVPATVRGLADGGRPVAAFALIVGAVVAAMVVAAAARVLTRFVPDLGALAHPAGFAVVAAHAIDGLSTWAVLRDPFGLGFSGFTEKNPVANLLVEYGNGWLFPFVKLLLSAALVLIVWRGTEAPEDRPVRAPAFLALFVLGWGPGVANLLLVAFGR